MFRAWTWPLIAVAVFAAPVCADPQYTVKQATSPSPGEVQEPIRKLLTDNVLQLLDDKGSLICEVWFRKEVPVKATPEQIKNGLTYRELEETTLLGAIRFAQPSGDYRKQKIKPGVYTLRLGFQPMDGDHMGTAPYPEFCLLVAAQSDEKPDTIEAKELRERSAKAMGTSHPGVLLLFPNEKPEATPKLVDKGNKTWVLLLKEPIVVDGQKTAGALGIGLTLVGQSTAE